MQELKPAILAPGLTWSRLVDGEHFRAIFDHTVDAILVLNTRGDAVHVNQSFLELWRVPEEGILDTGEAVINHMLAQIVNAESLSSRVNAAPGTYNHAGERLFTKDGRILYSIAWPLVIHGTVSGQVWNFRDVTERVAEVEQAQKALLDKERRFRALVENAADLITVVKPDLTIVYQSPSSLRVLGFTPESLIGSSLASLIHPDDIDRAVKFLSEAVAGGPEAELTVRLRDSEGQWHYLEVRASDRRLDLEIGGIVLNARDATSRHLLEQELMHQANHDPLTGLVNRRAFMHALESALVRTRDGGTSGALLMIDLDDFKDVNDSLGHQAGDTVLIELSALLRDELGQEAVVSRLGGDEFSILLPEVSPSRALSVSRRLLVHLRGHVFDTQTSGMIDLTASLGLVSFPRDGSTVDELMSRVDLAHYEAKARGRNQVSSFTAFRKLEARAESRLRLRHLIRSALRENMLRLHGQPILHLQSGQIAQHELLLRLKQKNGRLLPAGSFIDVAERSGLIVPIDRWVVESAISLLADESRVGPDQSIAVNLSARSFSDGSLSNWIAERLKDEHFNRRRLIFEITERDAITNIDTAQRFMHMIKDQGCRFALDDFGVGFSSLQRLRRLPVDLLKIDGSLIRTITRGAADRALVRSVVGIAEALHMETVAEFVERPGEIKLLAGLGVTFAQGNYIGKPRSLKKSPACPPAGFEITELPQPASRYAVTKRRADDPYKRMTRASAYPYYRHESRSV